MGSCASRAGRAREPGSGPETVRPFSPSCACADSLATLPPPARPAPSPPFRPGLLRAPDPRFCAGVNSPPPPLFLFLPPMARRPRVSAGVPAGRWPGGGRAEGAGVGGGGVLSSGPGFRAPADITVTLPPSEAGADPPLCCVCDGAASPRRL